MQPSTQIFSDQKDGNKGIQHLEERDTSSSNPDDHCHSKLGIPVRRESPECKDTVVKSILNRSSTATLGGTTGQNTYETFRKGQSMDASPLDPWPLPPSSTRGEVEVTSPSSGKGRRSQAETRQSRTLVKKRQPGSIAARKDIEVVCRL